MAEQTVEDRLEDPEEKMLGVGVANASTVLHDKIELVRTTVGFSS